ncbi:MAG: right-handed parallel beta-helix repeat-containing protein [Spartobacteria bacterium]
MRSISTNQSGRLLQPLRNLILGAFTVGLALSASTSTAAVVTCGQTITQNTVLTNDLSGCTNNGIIVGADNITLDLNGHSVSGTAASGDQAGIVLVGRTGVTVKNGTVRSFDAGVFINGGSNNTVDSVNAIDNISYENGPLTRGGDGIFILSSRNNRILRNTVANNGPYSGIAIVSDADPNHPGDITGVSSGNVIDSNTVNGNIQARQPNSLANTDNDGIRLEPGNTGNFVLNNRVNSNGLDGIELFARNTSTVVRGNIVTGNGFYRQTARRGDGINAFKGANDNLIELNQSSGNADNGIAIRLGALNNTVRNNTAVQNTQRPPIPSQTFGGTFDLFDQNANCDNNIWQDNRYGTVFPSCAADTP